MLYTCPFILEVLVFYVSRAIPYKLLFCFKRSNGTDTPIDTPALD